MTSAGRRVRFSELGSIWLRRPVAPVLREPTRDPDGTLWATWESLDVLKGMWRTFDGLWVNHPDRNEAAGSKLEQLRRAESLGFVVPQTIVTNDPLTLGEFSSSHPRGVICKPVRSGHMVVEGAERLFFTTLMTTAELKAFPGGGGEPYLFQALVEKDCDVRVTVIGEHVFAVRIESQVSADSRIDWRRGDQLALPHSVIDLPDDVIDRCLRLVRAYGLEFGAIDLAITPDGATVFFELNPNGQWVWLEQLTSLPLRATLADLLESGNATRV